MAATDPATHRQLTYIKQLAYNRGISFNRYFAVSFATFVGCTVNYCIRSVSFRFSYCCFFFSFVFFLAFAFFQTFNYSLDNNTGDQ